MDGRAAYHVALIGTDASLLGELRGAPPAGDGRARLVFVSHADPPGLDACRCDLVVVDVDRQRVRGLGWLRDWRGLYPHVPAVALVGRGDASAAVAAMKAGAADCLEKPLDASRLESVATTLLRERPFSWAEACKALTRTERRVLELVLAGKTTAQIALEFHRSRRTIEVHRRNCMRKLGVSHVSELLGYVFRASPQSGAPVPFEFLG